MFVFIEPRTSFCLAHVFVDRKGNKAADQKICLDVPKTI